MVKSGPNGEISPHLVTLNLTNVIIKLGQTKQRSPLPAPHVVGHQLAGDHAASHPQVARLLREGAQQQHV